MTKTKFEQKNFFTPQAEGKTFASDHFDKQAASQPMIEQFNKNTATMVAAVQERGNRNLEWIAIDNAHQEAMMEHNAHVDKINREYDLEQWSKFSQGAMSLLQQGLQIRKTQQTKAGYANILKARTTNPNEYKDYIRNIEIFENYKKSGETNGFIEAWKLKFKDPRLATSIIDATGWEEAAIADATLADRLAALPTRMDLLIENSKYSLTDLLPDTAILGKDAIDWDLKEAMSYTKFLEKRDKVFKDKLQPEWVTQVHNAYMGRHAEFLIDTFKPGDKFGVPYKTMLTEVQPHIDKLLNQHSLGWGQHVKRKVPETLRTRRDAGVKTYLQKGQGQNWNYTGQKFFEDVESTWPSYGLEGDTESHKRYLAASDKLNTMLKLQATDKNSGATLIELLGLVNSEVKGHRGGMTKTSEIFKKALADTDFVNRAEAQARAQLKLTKDNKENGLKTFLEAVRQQVRQNGPLKEIERQQTAQLGAEKGYGTQADIALQILDEMPTEKGLNIDQWVKRIKKDGVGKMLHRETYLEAGAPVEAVEHEDTKNLFYKDAKHVLPLEKRGSLINTFGLYVGGARGDKELLPTATGDLYIAGVNAMDRYEEIYKNLIIDQGGTDFSPHKLQEEARIQLIKEIDANHKTFLEPRDKFVEQRTKVKETKEELRASPTGRVDSVVISATTDQIEHLYELKKKNPNLDLDNFPQRGYRFKNKDGENVDFYDTNWDNSVFASKAGGDSRYKIMQLKAYDNKMNLPAQPLPNDQAAYNAQTYTLPPEIVTQMFTGKTPLEQQLEALKKNKPRGRTKGKTVGGVEIGGGGLVIKTNAGVPVVTQWKRDIKDLESRVKTEDLIDKPFSSISDEDFLVSGLGIAMEPFKLALEGLGQDIPTFITKFKKDHGLKEADLFTEENQKQMMAIIENEYGPQAYPWLEREFDWSPPVYPTVWDYLGGNK
jgi:hypothetical protein